MSPSPPVSFIPLCAENPRPRCEAAADTQTFLFAMWIHILASSLYAIFFPSLIIFSASHITSLTLGLWPRKGRKHTLLLILQGLWCLLTLLVISQDQEHRVTLENVSFLTGQNEKYPECLCSSHAERKRPGSQTILCQSSKTASPIAT